LGILNEIVREVEARPTGGERRSLGGTCHSDQANADCCTAKKTKNCTSIQC
jgi:hypothetical protein